MIYKAWLESRVWFVLGLMWLAINVSLLIARFPDATTEGTYQRHIQTAWFGTMPFSWVFLATILGSCGMGKEISRETAPFLLSLPVTRRRLLRTKAAVGTAEIVLLAVVPSLLISIMSPLFGNDYPFSEALTRSCLVVVAGMVFFALSFLQTTVLRDDWPTLIGCICMILIQWSVRSLPGFDRMALFPIFSKESYLNSEWAWLSLFLSVLLSVAMLYLAFRIVENADY